MRRPLLLSVAAVVALVAAPLAVHAAFAPSITLLSPSADDVGSGELAVRWSYEGFSPKAWVDVEVRRGEGTFTRVARVNIDDGSPGYRGSATWATAPADDGTDYTVRVVVPSNKSVHDSVSPVVVDNTAPEATELERTPAANDAGWHNGDVAVRWACTDATSGVVAPEVTATVTGEGEDFTASAVCEDLAGHTTTATAEGIDIDRTAPTAALVAEEPADGVPVPAVLVDVAGTADDGLSGVAGVGVTFTDTAGNDTTRAATCTGCGTTSATWTVSTRGLAPGRYTVSAIATDVAGNAGTAATAEFLVVAIPDPPETEVPEADVPGAEPPDTEPPEPTPPGGASVAVEVTVEVRPA